mmetsp:Transcript_34770/g.67263  ORF Transcript_34770/g.67263 Transcript_34770/m.67263 type:complete len:356 (-) Transcript_34770:1576-2643(-)
MGHGGLIVAVLSDHGHLTAVLRDRRLRPAGGAVGDVHEHILVVVVVDLQLDDAGRREGADDEHLFVAAAQGLADVLGDLLPEVPGEDDQSQGLGVVEGGQRAGGTHRDVRAGTVVVLLERSVIQDEVELPGSVRLLEDEGKKHHSLSGSAVGTELVAGSGEAAELVVDPVTREVSAGLVLGVEEVEWNAIVRFLIKPSLETTARHIDFTLGVDTLEGDKAGGTVDRGELEVGDVKPRKLGSLVERVSREEGDVLVIGGVKLALLVHLALGSLDVELGVLSHGVTTSGQEVHGVRHVREDVLGDDGIEFRRRWKVVERLHSPESNDSLVSLLDGFRNDVRGGVDTVGIPSDLLELV